MTDQEVKDLLIGGMPPGEDRPWDYERGLVGKIMLGLAKGHRATCLDWIERLRAEVNPLTLTDPAAWEAAFGITHSITAMLGTAEQRKQQVIGKHREVGEATFNNIRALMQPFFRYADPRRIQIIEPDRIALRTAHTYAFGSMPLTIPVAASSVTCEAYVNDDSVAGLAGAQVFINISGYLEEIEFMLIGPGPDVKKDRVYFRPGHLGSGQVTTTNLRLDAPELARRPLHGTWTLATLSRGPHTGTLHSAGVYVEGVGRDFRGLDGLGAALFQWGVVFDPTLVRAGAAYDLDGARKVIPRVAPAHTLGLLLYKAPTGTLYAIPDTDTAIPDAGIPE